MVLCASLDLFNTISNSFLSFYCSGPAVADSVVVVVVVVVIAGGDSVAASVG